MQNNACCVFKNNSFIVPKLSVLQESHIYKNLGLVVNDLKVSIQSLLIIINILLYNL